MKRRIALLALAAIMALAASAQKLYDGSRPDRLVEINPHVGVAIASIVQNYGSAVPGLSDFLMSPGCSMGIGVDVRFCLRESLGLATGLRFGINNSRYAMSILQSATGSISSLYVSNHYYDLTVPVYLSWRLFLGTRMAWNIDCGIYLANGLSGTTRLSGYTSGVNSLNQPVVTSASYETDYFKSDKPFINSVKTFDWGPRLATGFTYNRRYTFSAIFQISAPNLAINRGMIDAKYRNTSLAFEFGYIF